MTLPSFEWVDAPPPEKTGAPNKYDWKMFVGFLMAHPGKWALVTADDVSAGVIATRLRKMGAETAMRHRRLYVRVPTKLGGPS